MDKTPISASETQTDVDIIGAELMDQSKPFLQSKTLWFNLAVAAFAVLVDHADLLRNYLSDGSYLIVMMVISAVNIYLRTKTTTAVRLK